MSDVQVILPFAGEDRPFALLLKQLRAVQTRCDAGPAELLRRYYTQTWRIDDVREVLFQGLVGGGMADGEASRLLTANFDDRPLRPFVMLAEAIVSAAIAGPPDDQTGEFEGEADQSPTSPAENSGSAPSTEPPPSSDSPPAT